MAITSGMDLANAPDLAKAFTDQANAIQTVIDATQKLVDSSVDVWMGQDQAEFAGPQWTAIKGKLDGARETLAQASKTITDNVNEQTTASSKGGTLTT